MNKLDPKRVAIFIGVCTGLAIVIGSWWELSVRRQMQPQFVTEGQTVAPVPQGATQIQPPVYTPQARTEYQPAPVTVVQEQQVNHAEEQAATAHASYLTRYLNSEPSRQPGMKMVAVAIVSESGAFNFAVNAAVASHLKTASVATLTSFFRPAFVSDGLFANAFAGSNGIFDKLELSKSLDVLLLGREQVQYSSDPSLENVITANTQLELTAFSIADGQSQSWTYVANGAGFKQSEARQMAEERLIKQIANDPKMSLSF